MFFLTSLLSVLISSIGFSQQTIPWQDSQFGCIDSPLAQKYVRDFNIDTRSFGGLELCNANIDTKKLLNDISIIDFGRFSADGNNVFIRGFIPSNQYYAWMKGQTRGMDRGQDIPYATAYNSGGYFTMQDGWAVLSTLGRVGTIVHEARHTAGYRHYSCDQGPYEGANLAGCDTSYQQGGSHAIEMEYYARVSVHGQNFHPVYKSMARLMAIARGNAFFNQPVLQKKEGLLALSADRNQAELILNGQKVIREIPQAEGILKRTSFGGVIFNGVSAQSIELYGNDRLNTNIEDTYSYFKILLDNRLNLLDFEEFDIGTKRFVTRVQTTKSIEFFDFPRGQWARPVNLNFELAGTATRLENNQSGYFLIGTDARIYPVNPQNKTVGAALNFKWSASTLQVAQYENTVLVLKNNGLIYQRNSTQQSIWPGGQGRYRAMINVPVYDGFQVMR